MVDIETHRVIDMINSRELEDVTKWLQSYPNLQIFSRDGSVTYRNAINSAHLVNLQVSDKFHIFKNLTSYAKELLYKELKKNISIPKNQS